MSKGKFVLGAAIGAAAGVVAGLLTAPKSGKETRADLKKKACSLGVASTSDERVSSSKMLLQRATSCAPRVRRYTTKHVMLLATCIAAVTVPCAVLATSL